MLLNRKAAHDRAVLLGETLDQLDGQPLTGQLFAMKTILLAGLEDSLRAATTPTARSELLAKARQIEADHRKNVVDYLLGSETKALRALEGPAGGYLLSGGMIDEIFNLGGRASAMLRLCRTVLLNVDELGIPTRGRLSDATWTTELDAGSADATQPFSGAMLRPQPLTKVVKVTRSLLRRGGVFAEQTILEAISESISVPMERAFINGAYRRPLGVLADVAQVPRYTTAGTGAVTLDDVQGWIGSLPGRWHADARVLMHSHTFSALLRAGVPLSGGLLLGKYPVEFTDEMPDAGAAATGLVSGADIAVIGDYSQYLCQVQYVEVQRVEELYAEQHEVGFIARTAVDAQPVDPNSFVVLRVR